MHNKRAMMIGLDAADPIIIRKLIDDGRLPNIKRVLENGCAREDLSMLGAFPTVTPPNWASIATGNWPRTHGVTCYYNHTLGKDFQINEVNWDSRRVKSEFIWERFSKEHRRSIMLNYCEAWPPRIKDDQYGVYIDGTGVIPFMRTVVDFQKVVTLEEGEGKYHEEIHTVKESSNDCVVQGDQFKKMLDANESEIAEPEPWPPIAEYKGHIMYRGTNGMKQDEADSIWSPLQEPSNWSVELPENTKVATLVLNNGLIRRYAALIASDGIHYDTIRIYKDKKTEQPLGEAKAHGWSSAIFDKYYQDDVMVNVAYIIRCLEIAEDGSKAVFYISNVQDLDDLTYFYPQEMGKELLEDVGPMFSYAKFGKELEHEGAEILLESFEMLHDWHADATDWLFEKYPDWDLYYIHLHAIDLYAHWFIQKMLPGSYSENEFLLEMFYRIYESMDRYIGRMLKYLDDDTLMIITSDHGAIPRSVGDENPGIGSLSGITNTVMEELGYTKTYIDENGELQIDWNNTTAVYQRSSYIYINLKGRDPHGIVDPKEYKQTVEKIISDLYNYRHPETGKRVVAFCLDREEMEIVGMGGPHCGDILVQLCRTFCKEHAYTPSSITHEGFSMHNLCIMSGHGIKKGEYINRVIRVVDIVPTIAYLTDLPMPSNVEGGVIWQALENFEEEMYG